jgi:hypothetical protein
MNLLKLPSEVKDFLTRLKDPKDVRKYSERKLLSGSISVPKKDDKGSSTNGSNLIS